ncbi:hypothetical protein DIPPA_20305 [Diplonema papillatum]|nr:hypothetical protein DIPPA_20305 [Diplonema papillatum]|eukprot:gene1325-2042_t
MSSENGEPMSNPWGGALRKKSTGSSHLQSPGSVGHPAANPSVLLGSPDSRPAAGVTPRDRVTDDAGNSGNSPELRYRAKAAPRSDASAAGASPPASRRPSAQGGPAPAKQQSPSVPATPTLSNSNASPYEMREARTPEITPATPLGPPPAGAQQHSGSRGAMSNQLSSAQSNQSPNVISNQSPNVMSNQMSHATPSPMLNPAVEAAQTALEDAMRGSQASRHGDERESDGAARSDHLSDAADLPPPKEPDVEQRLAETQRELRSTQERVHSLQRLQATSQLDAKVRILNEERAKLAFRSKEMENRLNKEIAKLKIQLHASEREVTALRSSGAGTKEKHGKSDSKRLSVALDHATTAEQQVKEWKNKYLAAQQLAMEKSAELANVTRCLRKAQDALIDGAQNGFENEVKLHQARSALHAVLTEVSEAASPSPARDRLLQYMENPASHPQGHNVQTPHTPPHAHQQLRGFAGSETRQITSDSPPRYVYTYAQRQQSAPPEEHYVPSPYPPQLAGHAHPSY